MTEENNNISTLNVTQKIEAARREVNENEILRTYTVEFIKSYLAGLKTSGKFTETTPEDIMLNGIIFGYALRMGKENN